MSYYAMTRILYLDAVNPNLSVLEQAAATIRAGGLVAFPTETVYGLGANAFDAEATARIFAAKGRPANDPLIVHIADPEMLAQVAAEVPPLAERLAAVFWPGPLTLVLRKSARIPDNVSAGRPTVALRMPAHPIALGLIRAAGCPIAAPSANRFSRPSPTSAAHVLADLNDRVDLLLDGGPTQIGLESTIVDLSSETPVVLRPGGIALEKLQEYLPGLRFEPQYLTEDVSAPAPGVLLRHYAPQTPLFAFEGPREAVLARMRSIAQEYAARGEAVGVLALDEDAATFTDLAQVATLGPDIDAMAAQLFDALRTLDSAGLAVLLARTPEAEGLGLAIRDRLTRAAEGRILTVTG